MNAPTAQKPGKAPVKQYSLFADNKVGRLHEILSLLHRRNIHTLGLCTLDTTDNAIIRVIVSDGAGLESLLFKERIGYAICDVVAVGFLPSQDLTKITEALYVAEINIHYVYPLFIHPQNRGVLIIQTDDNELAGTVLRQVGLVVLDEDDLLR
jgi:hypothetical protein